jgi:3-oxoacyl-[acyl-carrier-protein] synthase II
MTIPRKVVVSGLGIIAANGIGKDAFWNSLLKGISGIDYITRFDTTHYIVKIAGEVKGFKLSDFVDGRIKAKRLARQTQLAVAAAQLALADARLERADLQKDEPIVVLMGVNTSAVDVIEKGKERLMQFGPHRMPPAGISTVQPHAVSSTIGEQLAVKVQALTMSTACAAGLDAIAYAAELIRGGKAEVALAGGADSSINPLSVACFGASGLIPKEVTDPQTAGRPFDRDREGGLMSEGSGVVILESLEHARARGARPYLSIAGYGTFTDDPGVEPATGLSAAMGQALANAG